MNEDEKEPYYDDYQDENDDGYQDDRPQRTERYRDEIFSKRVPAGKRTYFFDVKSTRSGSDFFQNLAQSIECDYLGYFPCTSPIIKKETYQKRSKAKSRTRAHS